MLAMPDIFAVFCFNSIFSLNLTRHVTVHILMCIYVNVCFSHVLSICRVDDANSIRYFCCFILTGNL